MRRIILALLGLSLAVLPHSTRAQDFENRRIVLETLAYDLDYTLDYENETLHCECSITVRNPEQAPIDTIPLLLYRLLEVSSITDGLGNAFPFRHRVLSFDDWKQRQVNYIEIELPNPLEKGEEKKIRIVFDGYLLGYVETGMRYVKDHIEKKFTILREETFAYPTVGYPSWKANRTRLFNDFDYHIRVNVPSDLIVANGGELVSRVVSGGRVTYTYRNLKPAWRIDLPIADYRILESGKNRIYYFPEDSSGAERAMNALDRTFSLFAEWFGPLSENKGFNLLEVPEGYGGQADVTSILLPADAFGSPERLYSLYHEISHLWNVTPAEDLNPRFVSEGLAMFLQHHVQEVLEDKPEAVKEAVEQNVQRFKQRCLDRKGCADIPMIDYGKADMTDLSYNKGMVFFAILHALIGEAPFRRIIGTFYQQHSSGKASSDDFLKHCQSLTRRDLGRFFQEWVYGTESNTLLFNETSFENILKRYE